MYLTLHLVGNAIFFTTLLGSLYGLTISHHRYHFWRWSLVGSAGFQFISGILLALDTGASIGRACLMGAALLVAVVPLHIIMGKRVEAVKQR